MTQQLGQSTLPGSRQRNPYPPPCGFTLPHLAQDVGFLSAGGVFMAAWKLARMSASICALVRRGMVIAR